MYDLGFRVKQARDWTLGLQEGPGPLHLESYDVDRVYLSSNQYVQIFKGHGSSLGH